MLFVFQFYIHLYCPINLFQLPLCSVSEIPLSHINPYPVLPPSSSNRTLSYPSDGEPEVPSGEQCQCVHQEGGGQDQRGDRAGAALPGQVHRGAHCQGGGTGAHLQTHEDHRGDGELWPGPHAQERQDRR